MAHGLHLARDSQTCSECMTADLMSNVFGFRQDDSNLGILLTGNAIALKENPKGEEQKTQTCSAGNRQPQLLFCYKPLVIHISLFTNIISLSPYI